MDSREKRKILIVDDAETNREILQEILHNTYEIEQASDGYEALSALLHGDRLPDMVLLDVMMPEMDGFEVFRVMKNSPVTADIPALFITASGSTENEIKGLKLGAADYITKPFVPEAVRLRVNNYMELGRYRQNLEREVEHKARELVENRENMLEILVDIIEYRDVDSGLHVRRTSHLTELLINEMLKSGFRGQLLELGYETIIKAAPLHDIGKIAVPDSILLKPGRLTAEEFEVVKRHTVIGGEIMNRIKSSCDERYYRHGKDICLHHHERWDGSGYPEGLKGEAIPLSARIMSVIDVYDALVSRRPYKDPFDHATAVKIIKEGAGSQFDPEIAVLFEQIESRLLH